MATRKQSDAIDRHNAKHMHERTVCKYCKCAVLAGQATYGMSGNHFDCHEEAVAALKVLEEINVVIKHYMDCRGMSREAATVAVMRERARTR